MNLEQATQTFLKDYRSAETRRCYGHGLRRFCDWSASQGKPIKTVNDLDPNDIRGFTRYLANEGLSPLTVQNYRTAVMRFMRFLKREKLATVDGDALVEVEEWIKNWNRKNKTQRLPRLPDEASVVTLLTASHLRNGSTDRTHLLELRQYALLETWAATGCRISESASLKRKDLVPDEMSAWVRGGKGNKDRLIIFETQRAWNAVQTYLKERDRLLEGFTVEGEEPVFSRHDRKAHGQKRIAGLSPNAMREYHNTLEKKAAVIEHFTPHQLRHRIATKLLDKTGNMALVQEFLGHEDISTTGVYAHVSKKALIKAVREE